MSAKRLRAAFDFLLARGYVVAAESDGIGGTVAYRSKQLWLSFQWDRWDPWLTFTVIKLGPHDFYWTDVDFVLNGKRHPEFAPNRLPEAPIPTLVAFVDANLARLEEALSAPNGSDVEKALRDLEAARRRELENLTTAPRFQ